MYLTTMKPVAHTMVSDRNVTIRLRWLSCAARTAIAIVQELVSSRHVLSEPSFQSSSRPHCRKVSA